MFDTEEAVLDGLDCSDCQGGGDKRICVEILRKPEKSICEDEALLLAFCVKQRFVLEDSNVHVSQQFGQSCLS